MRVIAGEFRGRRLFRPTNSRTRATSDKVKEALFNILGSRVVGAAFLDLYAGSGAIGIEAISRGATPVVFVEPNKDNVRLIEKNLSLLDGVERAVVFYGTHLEFLKQNHDRFDILYVDPPYDDAALEEILPTLEHYDTLRAQGVVIIEHFHKRILQNTFTTLSFLKRYRYGGTVLSSYVKDR